MSALYVLLGQAANGCSSDAARGAIDSLGVPTVVSDPAPVQWSLGEPHLTIGNDAAGPEYALYRAGPVKRHANGSIVVATAICVRNGLSAPLGSLHRGRHPCRYVAYASRVVD